MTTPSTSPSLIRAGQQVSKSNLKVVIGPETERTTPEIQVQRKVDDAIQTIEITCTCGEKIVLECKYQ